MRKMRERKHSRYGDNDGEDRSTMSSSCSTKSHSNCKRLEPLKRTKEFCSCQCHKGYNEK